MSQEPDGTAAFNRATRVPLEAVVRLHFEGEVSYQNGFSANVSATGMFVKHPEPHPIGSRLVFEFLVGSRRRPVQGSGEVTWIRAKYEGPGKPAGMGISFGDLDEGSRDHLTQALFEFLEQSVGGDLPALPDAAEPAAPAGEPFRLDADLQSLGTLDAPEAGGSADNELPALRFATIEEPAPVAEPTPAPLAPPLLDWHSTREMLRAPAAEDTATPHALSESGDPSGDAEPRSSRRIWLFVTAFMAVAAVGVGAWLWNELRAPAPAPLPPMHNAAAPRPAGALPPRATPSGAGVADPTPGAETATPTAPATLATAVPNPAVAAPVAPVEPLRAEPTPAALPRFSVLREVRVRGEAGATTVELQLDGSISAGDFAVAPMPGDNPRLLVKLRRAGSPGSRGPTRGATAELRGVRIGVHDSEVHVVLDLAGSDPRRAEVTPSGDRLVVRLPGRG